MGNIDLPSIINSIGSNVIHDVELELEEVNAEAVLLLRGEGPLVLASKITVDWFRTYLYLGYAVLYTCAVNKLIFKDVFGWGIGLWLIGYILGFVFFAFVPISLIGWYIMPIAILITFWVLLKKIKSESFQHYFFVAIGWTIIAVVFDYLFLVLLLKPADGYYKLDVYLYYALTFVLPLVVGWHKARKYEKSNQ